MVVCGRHHLWQPCPNLAHAPHGRLIDGQGRRPVRRPITAIHRLAGGTEAFEIPLGCRCEPVKHALVDITHLLSTESQELAKTAHACAQAKGACPHTRRGGGRVGGRDGTERPATSLPAGLLPPAAPHTPTTPCVGSLTSGRGDTGEATRGVVCRGVGAAVCCGVGATVCCGVGAAMCCGVGATVCCGVGAAMGCGVGAAVCCGMGAAVCCGVGAAVCCSSPASGSGRSGDCGSAGSGASNFDELGQGSGGYSVATLGQGRRRRRRRRRL